MEELKIMNDMEKEIVEETEIKEVSANNNTNKNDTKKEIIGWVLTIGSAVLIFLIALIFVQPGVVNGSSMEPNYYNGDRFFMVRDWIDDDYDYGDVVCVKMDDKILIKRIIGKPGDVIELIDGYVYRNGEKIDESAYLDDDVRTEMTGISSKFIVGMNQYFVLGDNRSISLDSRMIGPVSTVQGKTWFFFSKAWFK